MCTSKEVDIEAIICEIMKEKEVYTKKIDEEDPFDLEEFLNNLNNRENWSTRYFRGHALGKFKCEETLCDNSWPSAYAWCIIDLKKQKVIKKFKQECLKEHKDMQHLSLEEKKKPSQQSMKKTQGVYPSYEDKEAVTRMVEWAVNLHLVLVGRNEREETHYSDYRSTPEHRQDLCEMCQRLGRLCFERKPK